MSGLTAFRQQHPQYNDMPDAALADALHAKFYADIPKDQYLRSLGLSPAAAPAAQVTDPSVPTPTPPGARPAAPARPAGVRQTNPNTTAGLDMAAATGGALLGAARGAALGTPFGPPGMAIGGITGAILGGGLSYATSREAQQIVDRATGAVAAETPSQMAARAGTNVGTGALMEAGGRAVAPIVMRGVNALASGAGRIADLGNTAQNAASRILQQAAADRLPLAMNALRTAPAGTTPAQALAAVDVPVVQTVLNRATTRTPGAINTSTAVAAMQNDEALTALRALAGGETVTATKQAARAGQDALNERLIPTLRTELAAANTAGQKLPALTAQADQMAGGAAAKVEDVRRFTAAGERAVERAKVPPVPGQPRAPVQYTYMGELAKRADDVAETAARGSLAFGEAARFARSAADSLAAHGLKPLEAAPIVARIESRLADPKTMPGNDVLQGALKQVAEDIANWTKSGGVIDAWALDSIRKNSVNAAIAKLRPGLDAKAQNKLAAGILSDVRPLVTQAIEEAGGTGYGQYLKSYAEGMRKINERKMGGELLRLYETSPNKFVDLVEGNAPKAVEKVFGPGNIDIAEQMSPSALQMVRQIATRVKADKVAKEQVAAGERAYEMLLRETLPSFRLPNWFNPVVTSANRALDVVEAKLGRKIMDELTAAAQNGQTLQQALARRPAAERARILRVLSDPALRASQGAARATTGVLNAMVDRNENELVPQ